MRLLALVMMPWLLAAGTEPRAEAKAYEASAMLAQGDLGAEYLSRTVGLNATSVYVGKYLAVEVAIFPAKGTGFAVSSGHFRLRINRAGRELGAQPAGMVAAAIVHPEYEKQGGLVAGGSVGDVDVVFGQPRRVERFPGDPGARHPRNQRKDAPEPDPNTPEADAKIVRDAAMFEGRIEAPTAGVLYFAWPGKLKDIRSIELTYDGPAGKAVLKLK